MYEASQAELQKYKDKDSLNHGKIDLMYGQIANFKSMHFKDSSENSRLQKLVDKNTISAAIMSSSTNSSITGHTTISFPGNPGKNNANSGISVTPGIIGDVEHISVIDSTRIPCDSSCLPIYTTHYENKWEKVHVLANKDSITVNYRVFNEYSIVQKFEKRGKWPFRKEYPIIDITNHNPKTETTALKAFAVEPPKPHRDKWFVAGAILGALAAGLIITR